MDFNSIISNIDFINIKRANFKNVMKLLNIRNNYEVRNKMFNSKIITVQEHYKWFNQIKFSKNEDFYIICYKKIIYGGLGIKNLNFNDRILDWAFYVSPEKNFPGLGACIEFKSIDFIFNNYKVLKLFCYVLKDNKKVLNLHKKFYFLQTPLQDRFLQKYSIKIPKHKIDHLSLNLKSWKVNSKELKIKLKINE